MQGYDDEKTISFYDEEEMKDEPVVGWIVILSGMDKGRSFSLHMGVNVIGSASDADVLIKRDMNIRDKHAIVAYDPYAREFILSKAEEKVALFYNGQDIVGSCAIQDRQAFVAADTEMMLVTFCDKDFDWNNSSIN